MNEIQTDKWKIIVRYSQDPPFDEANINMIFKLNSDPSGLKSIKKEDLEELFADLKDLGKWRRYRELKKDLEQ